ncbi:MAG: hypothetical protein R3279_05900, partial [Putridiphycobacter sp.]|nr:hypothetical protein [Putridiphycobacter sp.]
MILIRLLNQKGGWETAKQKVLVMVESQAPTDGTHRGKRGKLRMVAVPTLDQVEIWKIEDQLLKRTSSIRT